MQRNIIELKISVAIFHLYVLCMNEIKVYVQTIYNALIKDPCPTAKSTITDRLLNCFSYSNTRHIYSYYNMVIICMMYVCMHIFYMEIEMFNI